MTLDELYRGMLLSSGYAGTGRLARDLLAAAHGVAGAGGPRDARRPAEVRDPSAVVGRTAAAAPTPAARAARAG